MLIIAVELREQLVDDRILFTGKRFYLGSILHKPRPEISFSCDR